MASAAWVQDPKTGAWSVTYDPGYGDMFDIPTLPTWTDESHLCLWCKRELCAAMDAYYGKDKDLARLCSPCRRKVTP